MNGKKLSKEKSFTLVEVLVVIAVIGLLSSVTLVAVRDAREKADIVKVLNFAAQVHHALGAYTVGEWKFDDNLTDTSGRENHGTWKNTGGPAPNNKFVDSLPQMGGKAFSFNGSDDYITIPSVNPTEKITVTAWVKSPVTNDYPGSWQIVSKYNAFVLGSQSGIFKIMTFIIANTTGNWQIPGASYTVPNPEKWHYFVGTYDSSTGENKLYVDGILRNTQLKSGTINPDTGPINIGRREGFGDEYFRGFIDDVRIYDEALTSTQIEKLYAEGLERHI